MSLFTIRFATFHSNQKPCIIPLHHHKCFAISICYEFICHLIVIKLNITVCHRTCCPNFRVKVTQNSLSSESLGQVTNLRSYEYSTSRTEADEPRSRTSTKQVGKAWECTAACGTIWQQYFLCNTHFYALSKRTDRRSPSNSAYYRIAQSAYTLELR